MKTLHVLALLLVLSCTHAASAQDVARLPTPSESTPEAQVPPSQITPGGRFDLLVPTGGVGWFTAPEGSYEETIGLMSFEARLVERQGHGVMLRGSWASNGWGGATGGDVDYAFRSRLVGNDVMGLGLDLNAGFSVANLSHDVGSVPTGLAYGGNVGASIDFRSYNFVLSLGVQYRVLMPTEGAPNGGATGPEHAITATFGGGFGFWGS